MSHCCVPICKNRGIYARGLCRRCYIYASKLVRARKTSWEQLEEDKKIAPATTPRGRPISNHALRDYFLGTPLLTNIEDRILIK